MRSEEEEERSGWRWEVREGRGEMGEIRERGSKRGRNEEVGEGE